MDFQLKKKNVRYRAAFASNYALDDNATQFGSVESRHTVSDNGPKRWDSSVVSQETRRCGANLTLVHRKRRRFLRGDRRSRYIIARLVVSSGARGDIQPLAAVKPSSHDPRFPPPYPLTSSFHVEPREPTLPPPWHLVVTPDARTRCPILFSPSLADIWFSLIPLRRSPVIREKLLSSPGTDFSFFTPFLPLTPSSSSSTLSILLRLVPRIIHHYPTSNRSPPLFFLLNISFFISLAVGRFLTDIAMVLVRIAAHVPSDRVKNLDEARLLATIDVRIFLVEFHGREIQKPFVLTMNYIARATALLNIEKNDRKEKRICSRYSNISL